MAWLAAGLWRFAALYAKTAYLGPSGQGEDVEKGHNGGQRGLLGAGVCDVSLGVNQGVS